MRSILALDPSTKTGWAVRTDSGEILSGTHKLKQQGRIRCNLYRAFLASMRCVVGKNPLVIYETPIYFPGRITGARLAWHFESVLWITYPREDMIGLTPTELKVSATGSGRADKDDMIAAMSRRFHKPDLSDDNEADALALLAFAMKLDPVDIRGIRRA